MVPTFKEQYLLASNGCITYLSFMRFIFHRVLEQGFYQEFTHFREGRNTQMAFS